MSSFNSVGPSTITVAASSKALFADIDNWLNYTRSELDSMCICDSLMHPPYQVAKENESLAHSLPSQIPNVDNESSSAQVTNVIISDQDGREPDLDKDHSGDDEAEQLLMSLPQIDVSMDQPRSSNHCVDHSTDIVQSSSSEEEADSIGYEAWIALRKRHQVSAHL